LNSLLAGFAVQVGKCAVSRMPELLPTPG